MIVARCPNCEALHTPGVTFNPVNGQVSWLGGKMKLPPAQTKVLGCLFRRPGRTVRTESLILDLYDGEDGGPISARACLGILIWRIRQAMKVHGFPGELRTHHRVGYELILHPVTPAEAAA